MKHEDANADQAGLIAIKIDGVAELSESQRIVSAALQAYAAEPLDWDSGKVLARLRREGVDPTTSLRVLAIEQTLGAATALRDAFAGSDLRITLACDVEPIDSDPSTPEYWVQRQRLESLVEPGSGDTFCRRGMSAARPLVLDRLRVHFEEQSEGQAFRLVAGPATTLVTDIGRWVTRYVESLPSSTSGGSPPLRWDIAREAAPTSGTRIVLVLAEAWVGKSYVAKNLWEALRAREIEVHFTSFENEAPDWPDDEFLKRASSRVWIVDAADEAKRRHVTIEKIGRSVQKVGLSTLIFSRPDVTLGDLDRVLGFSRERVATSIAIDRSKVRLLPLDSEQIRREFADLGEARLEALLKAAEPFYPPLTFEELRELDRIRPTEPDADLRTIRDGITRYRCSRLREGEQPTLNSVDDLFKAAQRLGIIAALSNEPRFHFGELRAPGFAVNDVFPADLRGAVHALSRTTVLERLGSGWHFTATHLEEDLAAGFLVRVITEGIVKVQALRSLLTDGRQPRPELERVIERAREGLDGHARQKVLKEALRPFEAGEAVLRFNKILGVARACADPLRGPTDDQLRWLDSPSVREEVRGLLASPKELGPVRHLALRVALENSWTDLAPQAAVLVLSSAESSDVRHLALSLAAKDPGQFEQMRLLLDRIPRNEHDEQLAELRAHVVIKLLQDCQITSLDAARRCPPTIGQYQFDLRAAAVAEVEKRLDDAAARVILDELRNVIDPKTIDESVCGDLREAAISVFLGTKLDANGEDISRLIYVIYVIGNLTSSHEGFETHDGVLTLGDAVRRAVYERMDMNAKVSDLFRPGNDAEWLIESTGKLAGLPDNVCTDLFVSIQALERRGSASAAERGREILRRGGAWDKFEAKLEAARKWKAQQQDWAIAREKRVEDARRTALPVERFVDTFLGERRDASLRLHVLGDFFFGERLYDTNVVGTLEDLPGSKRSEIIEATRNALNEATPITIPEGNMCSSAILDEGHAFTEVALWDRTWLDAAQVERWLASALFTAAMDSESRVEDLIERCFVVAPAETRRAVAGDMARGARQGHARTHRVPGMLWADERFRLELIALVRGLAVGNPKERGALGGLLDAVLGAYDTSSAPPHVRALIDDLRTSPDSAVSSEAIRAWFFRWPIESIDFALDAVRTVDDAKVIFASYFSLAPLYWARTGGRELPVVVTGRVVCHLIPLVPITQINTGRFVGPISADQELAELRDSLVRACIERRNEPAFAEAIEMIRQSEPYSGWLLRSERREDVEAALTSPARPWPAPEDVARIFRGTLALIHDVADLARLIAEIVDSPWDQSLTTLLYDGQKHAHEDKLQVLLNEKLVEGLKNAEPPVVTAVREPNERGTDEPDFVVITTNRPERLEVPIEVKWSDNQPAEGLENQLGERYLGNANRTHGVLVVGWTGEPKDLTSLEGKLEAARLRQAAKGRTIHVVVKKLLGPKSSSRRPD